MATLEARPLAGCAALLLVLARRRPPRTSRLPARAPNILWILVEDASPDIGSYGDPLRAHADARSTGAGRRPVHARVLDRAGLRAEPLHALHRHVRQFDRRAAHAQRRRAAALRQGHAANISAPRAISRSIATRPTTTSAPRRPRTTTVGSCSARCRSGPGTKAGPRRTGGTASPGQPFFAVISPQVTHESRLFMPDEQFAKEAAHLKPADRHDPPRRRCRPTTPTHLWHAPTGRATTTCGPRPTTRWPTSCASSTRTGWPTNTIVIFASDHGRGFPRAKRWAYDPASACRSSSAGPGAWPRARSARTW